MFLHNKCTCSPGTSNVSSKERHVFSCTRDSTFFRGKSSLREENLMIFPAETRCFFTRSAPFLLANPMFLHKNFISFPGKLCGFSQETRLFSGVNRAYVRRT